MFGFGVLQLVGGVAVGGGVGWLGAQLVNRARLGAPGLYPVLALGIAGLGYGLAVAVGASGFLSVYVCGIALSRAAPRRRRAIREFQAALSVGVEVGLFLVLGLLVFPSRLLDVAVAGVAVVAVLVLLARPAAVAVSLLPFGTSAREVIVASWLGMRGAAPIILATFVFAVDPATARAVFDVVFLTVLVSTLLQGTTAEWLLRRLGMAAGEPAWSPLVEVLPLDEAHVDLVEVTVPEDSPVVGRPIRECPLPGGALVTSIVRGERVLVPRGDDLLEAGDHVYVATTDRDRGVRDIERWVMRPVEGKR